MTTCSGRIASKFLRDTAQFKGYAVGLAAVFTLSSVPHVAANDGFIETPPCMPKSELLESRKTRKNEVPTGLIGSHPVYKKMEFLADPATGRFSVIGDAVSGSNAGKSCLVAASPVGFPELVSEQPYWKEYFAKVSGNQALLKKFMGPK